MTHEFSPVLSIADWISVLLLPFIGILGFFSVIGLARAMTKRGRNAVSVLLLGFGISFCLLATPLGQSSRLSTFSFKGSQLVVSGFGSPFSLLLCSENKVEIGDSTVVLQALSNQVSLPNSGKWCYQDMIVDSFYIANEFRGRSARRDKNGNRLAAIENPINIQTKHGNKYN